jgi:catechol 2,3-dioxygenase-like lactoylglutathione lyase family enzyme
MLHHVSLETRRGDADAAVAFWSLLGFEPTQPPTMLVGRAIWVQREGTHIHLLFTDDPVVPPEGHTAVVAPDYDTTLTALRAAGHLVEPHREHWGGARAFVRDPSGHLIEVMAAPPPG